MFISFTKESNLVESHNLNLLIGELFLEFELLKFIFSNKY